MLFPILCVLTSIFSPRSSVWRPFFGCPLGPVRVHFCPGRSPQRFFFSLPILGCFSARSPPFHRGALQVDRHCALFFFFAMPSEFAGSTFLPPTGGPLLFFRSSTPPHKRVFLCLPAVLLFVYFFWRAAPLLVNLNVCWTSLERSSLCLAPYQGADQSQFPFVDF